jgi:hypothetical protein
MPPLPGLWVWSQASPGRPPHDCTVKEWKGLPY